MTEHVALDLSFAPNQGEPPQCWTCGLPWPSEGICSGVPTPDVLAVMLEDPYTWADALATEVRRLHTKKVTA